VLVVDHVAGVEAFRRKYEILAAAPDLEITVLVPERWIEYGREVRAPRDVEGYRVRTGRVVWPGLENRGFFVSGVAEALLAVRPHVLHLQEEPFSLIALQCALLCRVLCPSAQIVFYTFDNLNEGFRYPYRPSMFYGVVQRVVHRLSRVGAASCLDAGRILRSRGFEGPIRYVPLGVDPGRYRPPGEERGAERARRGLDGFVVGYVGRLLAMKGIDTLVDAMPAVPGDWTLLVLGAGPERERVEARARQRGIADRVRIVPGVPHEEVPRWLGLLDVMVLPSRTTGKWKEQFGRVLTEAMACGVPVVGSSSGAIPEVIGDAGRIFPEGDSGLLGEILAELAGNAARRRRLAEAGHRRVLEHFTWEVVTRQWREIWDGLARGDVRSEDAPAWLARPAGGVPPNGPG